MAKALTDMTLEELWELFPIFLTEHQTCWTEWYEEEAAHIRDALCDLLFRYEKYCSSDHVRIHHIGSTAIEGIMAKPIIDILVEIPESTSNLIANVKSQIVSCGYLCMSESDRRLSFNKGYTSEGFAEKVYHMHLRFMGDNDELYFRDYMNAHPDLAKEYEALKLSLWKKYEHNRDAYTEAKTEFILKWTNAAKADFKNKYSAIPSGFDIS